MLQQLNPNGTVTEIYRNKLMKNQHGGAIRVGDFVYGYSDGPGWLCHDLRTGKQAWRERDAFGKGAIGYADGMLYCLDEQTGTVVLIEASPEAWTEQGRFIPWSRYPKFAVHPAVFGFIRSSLTENSICAIRNFCSATTSNPTEEPPRVIAQVARFLQRTRHSKQPTCPEYAS